MGVEALVMPDLPEIRKRVNAATAGPWYPSGTTELDTDHEPVTRYAIMAPDPFCEGMFTQIAEACFCDKHEIGVVAEADAEFIAHAREDVVALLNCVRDLEIAATKRICGNVMKHVRQSRETARIMADGMIERAEKAEARVRELEIQVDVFKTGGA